VFGFLICCIRFSGIIPVICNFN